MTNRRQAITQIASLAAATLLPHWARSEPSSTPQPNLNTTELGNMDTHAHIFKRDLKLADVRRYAPQYDAPLSQYLAMLDAHQMMRGVLIQPSFLGTDNSFMLSALEQYPERLRGIAVISPDTPKADMQSLQRRGIVGVRLNLVGLALPDLTNEIWRAFLKNISDLHWQIEIHREAKDLPQLLPPLLDAGLNIVLDHFGRPNPASGVQDAGFQYLLQAAKSRQIWVKLSGAYRNGANGAGDQIALEAIPLLRNYLGVERLVWGSDWPHTQFEDRINYDKMRQQLDSWLPDKREQVAVLQDTPQRLFWQS